GVQVLSVVDAHDAGRAVIVVGEHVQGIDAGLGARRLLAGLGRTSHWGLRVFKRRIGVLVVAAPEDLGADAATLDATLALVAQGGLAGVAVASRVETNPQGAALAACADRHRLFILAADAVRHS